MGRDMVNTLGTVEHISQVISQVVAPSFMLSAVVSFISMLFARMDVVVSRVRELNGIADDDAARNNLKRDIPRLQWRIKVMHRSIMLAIYSGIATTILIISAFAIAIIGFQHVWGTAALFIIALGFFCASLTLLALDVFRSISDIEQH